MGEWAEQAGSVATTSKEYVGKVKNYYKRQKVAEIRMDSGSLHVGDRIYIQGPTTGSVEYVVPGILFDEKTGSEAVRGDSFTMQVPTLLRRNDKIYKILSHAK